ncbi:MAG: peptide-N4-asparagine amidase [Acidianus sp.]|jgi:hypothetical protein|nr:peptide-N4-asparagine amidase [Acidianus sp.]
MNKKKIIPILSSFLFFVLVFSLVLPSTAGTISATIIYKPIFPLNMTISKSAMPFTQDPAFYSFEAYHIVPPNVTPIVVTIAKNLLFNDTGLKPYYERVYIPPGNYSLEILNVTIREFNGTQYDRCAYVYANGIPIFWGSTQEINNSTAEADVTLFENLLQGNVTFELVIQNYYDAKIGITGLYEMNVTLYLYPGQKPQGLPNGFIPIFVNATCEHICYNYSYVILNPRMPARTQEIQIPNGTYRMMALIYEKGGGNDEFWYACEPATRPILVYYDNLLAGVVNPYETIYTGGIDLFYWKPLTSINTLSFHSPYIIDLTPFLALGNKANITVCVYNLITAYEITQSMAHDWDIAGVILLWVNESNPMICGKLNVAKHEFIDSGPMFFPVFFGECYLEDGHYYLDYSAELKFEHGIENSQVIQKGFYCARQKLTEVYEYAFLDEKFMEKAVESGMYNATLCYNVNYPITLNFDTIAVPITNPHVIPFNLTYEQNGTISLGLDYYMKWTFGDYCHEVNTTESLYSVGGFGGIIEIINSYGGAVLVKLSSNYAMTIKNLTSTWLVNGEGFKETFSAEGLQNSTVNFNGYYVYVKESFSSIGSSDPPAQYNIANEIIQIINNKILELEI